MLKLNCYKKNFLPFSDSNIDPSLQDRQRQLKRARLVDDLNEKLAHRPGPLELVEGNIIQTDGNLVDKLKGSYQVHGLIVVYT